MKALKKLTAIALAVCMMIGMPLSIDVSAVTSSSDRTTFELLQAMPYVADPRYADTTGAEAKYLMLYFNGAISNTYDKVEDGGTLWTTSDMLILDSDGKLLKTETDSSKEAIVTGWIDASAAPQGSGTNPFRWQLTGTQVIDGLTLSTFREVKQLLEREYYASKGAKLVLRIVEQGTNANKDNGVVDSYYNGKNKDLKLKATQRITWGSEQVDACVTEVTWNPVLFTKVQMLNDTRFVLHFSEPINQNADKGNIFIAARIVDTTNNYALKYVDDEPQQWGLSGGWAYYGGNLSGKLSKPLSEIQALCDGFNEAENTDKYKVMFCLEEIGNNLSVTHGEYVGNGYVDSMWGKTSGTPLMGSTMPAKNMNDGAYCEFTTAEELKNANMTITGVYPVSREDQADKLVVEFSDPVNEIKGESWIRAFGADDALLTHDKTTKKLTNVNSGHLQWQVIGWTKASNDGTRWIGTIKDTMGFGQDTYAEIVDYLSTITDAQDKAVTPSNGYKIQLAFLDNSSDEVPASGLIEGVKSADGTKMLYAANVQTPGEERGVSNISASLNITAVDVYADTYVVVTFSEDIDMAQALSQTTSTVWISATPSIDDSSDPVKYNNTSHIQTQLGNARQFGNAKNKIVYDMGTPWSTIKERAEAYEDANDTSLALGIHIQGGTPTGIIAGFVSEDGERVLYNSAPVTGGTWAGRYKTYIDPVPFVSVSSVKADAEKNALILTFSEPVKYTEEIVELRRPESNGGNYTQRRTQLYLQRFLTDPLSLDLNPLYQPTATSVYASDADGNSVTDEYSQYLTLVFDEGVVETAIGYYAANNQTYSDSVGYGFGVFEATAGGGEHQIIDTTKGLPMRDYLEDFATAPDADGNVKYLKVNSTASGMRYFAPVTGVTDELVTVTEAKLTAADTVQITFSDPVTISNKVFASIRVTENNNLAGGAVANQLAGTLTPVNAVDGYAQVYTFKADDVIAKFAQRQFFNTDYSKTLKLCMSFEAGGGPGHRNGAVEYIVNANGTPLASSLPWHHGADGAYIDITNDPMLFTDSIIQKVELIGQSDAMVTVSPIQSYGGTKSWRIIDGATGVTKVIDGTEAVWKILSWQNYLNGNTQMVASNMKANLGVKTFDGIRGLMDSDDKLVLAFSDTRLNGVIDDFFLNARGDYKIQKAHFSTATEDVAYFVVDPSVTKEALTVTDISTYTRLLQTYANKDEFFVITFSHDISDETVAKIKDGTVALWITVKDTNGNDWWYDFGDGRGYVLNGSKPYHSQIAPSNFSRYGNSGNKLVAAVSGSEYKKLVDRVADINSKLGYEAAELVIRIENGGLNGFSGVNTLVTPKDSNVLPLVINQGWNNGGRSYTLAVNEGKDIHVGSIKLTDSKNAEITFVDDSGNPVIVTNQLYNPNSGVYVAIRMTKDGKLAWSYRGQLAAEGTGSPMQFDASLKTKNGTTADSTWVLSSTVDMAELMQALNDENGYLRKNGVDMAFALEGGNKNGEIADYMDVFTTLDGKGILKFTTDTSMEQTHRYFYSYLNNKSAWITGDLVKETVKIASVKAINNGTLQVTFDQAVNITSQGWTGLRIVDGVNSLIRFDDDKATPLGNIMTVGEKNEAGSASGLAHKGMSFAKADEEGKVWNFTVSGGIFGHFGFTNLVEFVESLPATGANWNGELKLALILEEGGTKNNGLTDRVVAADGSGAKLANDQMGNSIGDGTAIEITADMLGDLIHDEPLTIVSTTMANKNQLVVKFSEPVSVDNPFIGLRLVDENNELIWSARDAQGNTIRGKYNQGQAMQWPCTKWEYNNEAQDEIVVTFKQDLRVVLDASNLPACVSPTSNPDYEIKLVIEETKPEDSNDTGKSGLVCDVVAKSDETNLLNSNSNHQGNNTSWDGNASSIENVITPDTLITVSDAKITGENQVTFKWSHSVDLTKSGTYFAAFRYINEETNVLYGNDKDGWMQFGAYLNYTDSAMMEMTAHIIPSTKWGVFDIDDILNPTGALKEYMDANPGKWVLRIEEMGNGGNGTIDSFAGKDGTTIQANPFIGSWADGVYMNITGTPITGELSVTGMEIISDTSVKVTFSAPVAYKQVNGKDSAPYVSLRLYNEKNQLMFWNPYTQEYTNVEQMKDKDGNRIYENQNGYTLEKEGYNAQGEWVPYAAQNNQAMMWGGTPSWGDDKHTSIVYVLAGGKQLPVQNLTDILNYDFTTYGEGWYLGFDIEENTPGMVASSGHVDNIVRADNPAIALDANFFPHNRDSVMMTLDQIKVSYKPYKITSKTEVISDTQIRISFSEAVQIPHNPFMAIRMIDKEGNLMWSGKENVSLPYQWSGTWKWEDDSHKAIIWSMTQTSLGASTIYDLANWKGVLQKYKNEGTWMFVIEELDNAKNNFKVGRYNNLVDNVMSLDGTVHLQSTYSKGLDGILTKMDVSKLVGPEVEILSAQAIDDQTIKLTFTEAVDVSENVSMGVRYLSASGDSEVLTDGKVAYFKGDWEYADETKTVIIWTLNSKNADNLTDIINYNGKFEWNKGARVAFVIMDAEEERGTPSSMRIKGIYDMVSGFRTLKANYATEDYPMAQLDIEVLYDIPAPESQAGTEQQAEVVYVTNYIPFIIASCVIAVAGLVVAIILYKKRKKNEQ